MTKFIKAICLIFTCALFSQNAVAGWSRVSKSTIALNGSIGKNSYNDYLRVSHDGFSDVILNSGGGYPSVALKIASDIQSHPDVGVRVKGVCFSACANYLAISGDSLRVDCDSVIGWHGDLEDPADEASSMKTEGIPAPLIVEYINWLKHFHSRELAFYKRSGVDYAIIKDSISVVKKLNLTVQYSLDRTTGEYSYTTTAGIWVPPFESLSQYGIKNLKYCRNYTQASVSNILKAKGVSAKFSMEKTR